MVSDELIVLNKPKSTQSEAFRTLRTNILFSAVDSKIKSLLVTSTMPSEGKSFISANLAVSFAQSGSKVLIVDTDMRKGRQHKIFGVENGKGLSNLLLDDKIEDNYELYIQDTEVENISILTSGIVPPNPSELLSSDKLKKLVKILSKKYDLVIYDGVPIMGLADSVIMADVVDKILIVTAYKKTQADALSDVKKTLEPFKDKIAGVVLNEVDNTGHSYYDYYY